MQAGGRRFDPDRLHQLVLKRWVWVCVAEKKIEIGIVGLAAIAGLMVPLALPLLGLRCVFFVRVNQVLVRLWALPFAFV